VPACRNAWTMLSPEAAMDIGQPVASGATDWTAVANR
jgi:hypothetical protein